MRISIVKSTATFTAKSMLIGAAFLLSSLCLAHEESRVSVEIDAAPRQAGTLNLEFQLIDLEKKVLLEEKDLAVTHEKKLHVFIFDPALQEFRHEHPSFSDSKWRLTTELPVNGNYWIWAQGEILADSAEFAGNGRLKVIGGKAQNPTPPVLGDVRTGTDGTSRATFSNQAIRAKKMVMLDLNLSRTDGSKPQITPYLGAFAHVMAVYSDAEVLVHVHPMDTDTPTQLMIHATFPDAGDYRIWVQFMDAGVLKTVPMSVTVKP